jgi:hypothetical protein
MVLLKGFWFGYLYNMQGITIIDGCKSFCVPNIGVEEEKPPIVSKENTMLWDQRLGHIGEKGIQVLRSKGIVEFISKLSMDFYFH